MFLNKYSLNLRVSICGSINLAAMISGLIFSERMNIYDRFILHYDPSFGMDSIIRRQFII